MSKYGMQVISLDDCSYISGGIIGGGKNPWDFDISEAHTPGQNSWGEDVPGGLAHYEYAMQMGEADARRAAKLTQMVDDCTTGNLLSCSAGLFDMLGEAATDAAAKKGF